MNELIVSPIVLPLIVSAGCVLLARHRAIQRALSLLISASVFFAGVSLAVHAFEEGIQITQLAGWKAPIGITLVADVFASIMVAVTGLVSFSVILASRGMLETIHERAGFFPVVMMLLAGLNGAFLTGDLFNLFVWFEVLLLSSFILLSLGSTRAQLEGGIKYVTMNVIASVVLLAAVGMTYGLAGTVNMADLSERVAETRDTAPWSAVLAMFLVAFGIKAAIFPFFFWLPASYHTPPVVVTALFSALLSKVGLYAIIRTFGTVFGHEDPFLTGALFTLAAATMISGVLGAVAQYDLKRLLAFHIVSQVGYVLLAIALGSGEALAAGLVFMLHVILAKSALFLVAGIAERLQGTSNLRHMGGLYVARPVFSLLFLVPALSLAGIPPLSGFVGKFALIRSAIRQEAYVSAAIAVGVGLLTLFSMIKIWREAFWKHAPLPLPASSPPRWTWIAASLLLASGSILLGVFAGPVMRVAERAAEQVLDRPAYVRAVLGAR